MRLTLTLLASWIFIQANAQPYVIQTLAGSGTIGDSGDDGPAVAAALNVPQGLALDADGNLYFSDGNNHNVRRVDAITGIITHVAGLGAPGFSGNGGPATDAGLNAPFGLAFDAAGDLLVAERDNFRIRRIDATDGTISTFAGTGGAITNTEVPADIAQLYAPIGLAIGTEGNIYFTQSGSNSNYVRYFDGDSVYVHHLAGIGSTGFTGDGLDALTSAVNTPYAVAVAPDGNVYFADLNNHLIRMVDITTGLLVTVAGTGVSGYNGDGIPATSAKLAGPSGIAVDAQGNLYIGDTQNNRIRKVDGVTGLISTIAGTGSSGYNGDGGDAVLAHLNQPSALTVDGYGRIFFCDGVNHRVRTLSVSTIGVAEIGEGIATVQVHPSPASEMITVNCTTAKAGERVVILDARGAQVASMPLDGCGQAEMDVHALPDGHYFVNMAGFAAVPVEVVH